MSANWQDMVNAITAAREVGDYTAAKAMMEEVRHLHRIGAVQIPPLPAPPPLVDGNAPLRGRSSYSLNERLMVRMGWPRTTNLPWRMHLDKIAGKVFVFGIKDGEAFTLVDDDNMFPSDQMVTQLRMLEA